MVRFTFIGQMFCRNCLVTVLNILILCVCTGIHISMECDLSEAMKKTVGTSFEQSDLKHMLHQILSAVNHIHEKWYIHRDLKTSNIFLSSNTYKLTISF